MINPDFNPNEHLIKINGKGGEKDYLPVQYRLVWFRMLCPEGTIDTEEIEVDLDRDTTEEVYEWNRETRRSEKVIKEAKGYARFRAIVTDGKGGRATGTKSEKAASFPDFIEKAETGAIGRALAALGFGTQFAGEEFDEAHRIVDSPVSRTEEKSAGQAERGDQTEKVTTATEAAPRASVDENAPASNEQLTSIRKLYGYLKEQVPATLPATYGAAKEEIARLNERYRNTKAAS